MRNLLVAATAALAFVPALAMGRDDSAGAMSSMSSAVAAHHDTSYSYSAIYVGTHAMHHGLGLIAILIFLVIGIALIALHFLPGIIATRRHHRNALAIWLVNIFLGWTLIGWVIALVWALN